MFSFTKFLRTSFLQNISKLLLLSDVFIKFNDKAHVGITMALAFGRLLAERLTILFFIHLSIRKAIVRGTTSNKEKILDWPTDGLLLEHGKLSLSPIEMKIVICFPPLSISITMRADYFIHQVHFIHRPFRSFSFSRATIGFLPS